NPLHSNFADERGCQKQFPINATSENSSHPAKATRSPHRMRGEGRVRGASARVTFGFISEISFGNWSGDGRVACCAPTASENEHPPLGAAHLECVLPKPRSAAGTATLRNRQDFSATDARHCLPSKQAFRLEFRVYAATMVNRPSRLKAELQTGQCADLPRAVRKAH